MGTLLEITEHSNLEDGRMLVNNVGRQRFKILEVRVWVGALVVVVVWGVRCWADGHLPAFACPPVSSLADASITAAASDALPPLLHLIRRWQVVEEKPVLVCEVEYLQDDDESGSSAEVRVRMCMSVCRWRPGRQAVVGVAGHWPPCSLQRPA